MNSKLTGKGADKTKVLSKKSIDVKKMSESQTKAGNHLLTLDILNNFCFHVYAQKSLIIGENGNVFFYLHIHHHTVPLT